MADFLGGLLGSQRYYAQQQRAAFEQQRHLYRLQQQDALNQRERYYTLSSCAFGFGGIPIGGMGGLAAYQSPEDTAQHKKAEKKALLLMQNHIGVEQCDIYRATYRVILNPGFWWIIGDVFGSFNHGSPFLGKPDVIRIDNIDKHHITTFCVDQIGGQTPYTDKVLSFATHLLHDEKAFTKAINRIGEKTLDVLPDCAEFNTSTRKEEK